MDFFLCFGLFSTYVHGKKSLGLLYRKKAPVDKYRVFPYFIY